jgi:membrane-bound lytic murein transglycosylase F
VVFYLELSAIQVGRIQKTSTKQWQATAFFLLDLTHLDEVDLSQRMRGFYSMMVLLPVVCDPGVVAQRPVVPPTQTGELVVLTRNAATARYLDSQGHYSGLEYDLVELFARDLGLRVRYLDRQPFYQILPALKEHRAHFAAAGIAISGERLQDFRFGPAYQMMQPVIAYNTANTAPKDIRDVIGKRLEVVRGSVAVDELRRLKQRYPQLHWLEVDESDSEGLLSRLSEGKVDYVVTDSNLLDLVRNFYPNLGRGFTLADLQPLAWAFPADGDPALYQRAQEFFMRISYDGTLKQLLERYYGHVHRLDQMDIANFLERRQTQLPTYAAMFKEAQELTGIDWRLLAALGFQESHWDPIATSPTGVRGLMMLTSDTADRMALSDRLDARQSILAGARYLQDLKESLPARITDPNRTWLALAAYNIGLGHLEDARVLTQRRGANPDLWVDVKKALPLLTSYEYYSTLKHGFCRGGEALVLTENTRNYYDILARFEEPHAPGFRALVGTMPVERGSVSQDAPAARPGAPTPGHTELAARRAENRIK